MSNQKLVVSKKYKDDKGREVSQTSYADKSPCKECKKNYRQQGSSRCSECSFTYKQSKLRAGRLDEKIKRQLENK